ncbi:hypothetical protein NDU88_011398 [Pleurodeles waltl]|uniref:Uncharacterized protein n=1 Tax=Pleurodeles waltl TaxID=8319 RepID=A0AAV7R199_PLEWA|nr:hypothetical protein NDU88_011398 [Pleurodeles waltl]
MKVVKVLNGAVQLEDGRVRNLRHVSLFKASNIPQEFGCEDFDEESGYLWGYEDARPDRGEGGGEFREPQQSCVSFTRNLPSSPLIGRRVQAGECGTQWLIGMLGGGPGLGAVVLFSSHIHTEPDRDLEYFLAAAAPWQCAPCLSGARGERGSSLSASFSPSLDQGLHW